MQNDSQPPSDSPVRSTECSVNGPLCGKCGEESNVTEYHPDKGWCSWCKKCRRWTDHGE